MAKAKPKIPAPKYRSDAANLLAELGTLQTEILTELLTADEDARAARARAAIRIAPLKARADAVRKTLKTWADKYRDELVEPGTKTVRLTTGELTWRDGPEALELIEEFEEAALIAALRKAGFADCVRVVQELDKEQIKKLWPHLAEKRVAGFRLVQREFFQLKPLTLAAPIEVKTKTVNVVDELDGKLRKEKST